MATGPRLRAYLALERAMIDLDDAGDPVGDELRDRMDPIWLKLSDEERDELDGRIGDPSLFAGTLPLREPGRTDELVVATRRSDLTVRGNVRSYFRRAA